MTTTLAVPPPAIGMPEEEIRRRAQTARAAAQVWRRYSLTERVAIVRTLWKDLLKRKDELLTIVHDEIGRPAAETEALELSAADLIVKYYTAHAHRLLQDQAAWRPWLLFNKRTYVRYVPRGLVGLVTPWNFPFLIPMGDALAAIIAGNAVLLKPSEWATRTALWTEAAVKATGLLPEGLFAVATGGGEAGKLVVEEADMVMFTGSTKSGKLVAQACAAALKPCVLELGGKHAMIVFKDAALARAAKAAVWGAFANCGQVCVGVERVYVEADIHDAFVAAVRGEMAGLRQGLEGEVEIGRMVFPPQFERVKDHLEDARQKGAQVIGGEVLDEAKLMISPALVLGADHSMKVMTEETFGPVLPVMKVERGEEAIRLSNEGPFGLSASVWTRDLEKGERLGAQLEAGLIGVNDLMSHYAVCSLPFGGVKDSGLGRRHGDEGLRQFCWQQSVFVHEWPASQPELWWFPYTPLKRRIVELISKLA